MILLKTPEEIAGIARAGAILARVFRSIRPLLAAETKTLEIDACVRDLLAAAGVEPLFLHYHDFPAHCCVSVNDEVVHGIPGERRLAYGDIVKVDIGARLDRYCADSARTFLVGDPSAAAREVVECARLALEAGVSAARPGNRIRDITAAIEASIRRRGLFPVERFTGHGTGRELHEEPQVPNASGPGSAHADLRLSPGLVLAIEPMVNQGSPGVVTLPDGWTVVTADGGVSAHFEDTVAITDGGPWVLTPDATPVS